VLPALCVVLISMSSSKISRASFCHRSVERRDWAWAGAGARVLDCAVTAVGAARSASASRAAAGAATGVSASLAAGELEEARRIARLIGIRHEIVATDEFASDDYTRNASDRCYHCKTELYSRLESLSSRGLQQLPLGEGEWVLVNGANLDDLGDYRPGMRAAAEHAVRSPLAECGFTKADVRALAAAWNLPVWDKPASPCLSSRVAYGEEVTPARLAMIDAAEQHLRAIGLATVRVRYHRDDLARLEVPLEAIPLLAEPKTRDELVAKLRGLGFKFITLDLEGFRSGSLNALVTLNVPSAE
jgi:uncharacterized protein